jgi:hypothetical protein
MMDPITEQAETLVAELAAATGLATTRDPDQVLVLLRDHDVIAFVQSPIIDTITAAGRIVARWPVHITTRGPGDLAAADRLYVGVAAMAGAGVTGPMIPTPLNLTDDMQLPAYLIEVE